MTDKSFDRSRRAATPPTTPHPSLLVTSTSHVCSVSDSNPTVLVSSVPVSSTSRVNSRLLHTDFPTRVRVRLLYEARTRSDLPIPFRVLPYPTGQIRSVLTPFRLVMPLPVTSDPTTPFLSCPTQLLEPSQFTSLSTIRHRSIHSDPTTRNRVLSDLSVRLVPSPTCLFVSIPLNTDYSCLLCSYQTTQLRSHPHRLRTTLLRYSVPTTQVVPHPFRLPHIIPLYSD